MKICTQAREKGVALLIVLFMVMFLFAFVTANSNALFGLKREIKLVDQKQKARWNQVSTNRVEKAAPAQETKQ
jgi:type II secretory pathway component PulK